MLTTVLTDKLTKNKKVFGSTLDKILEVDIQSSILACNANFLPRQKRTHKAYPKSWRLRSMW